MYFFCLCSRGIILHIFFTVNAINLSREAKIKDTSNLELCYFNVNLHCLLFFIQCQKCWREENQENIYSLSFHDENKLRTGRYIDILKRKRKDYYRWSGEKNETETWFMIMLIADSKSSLSSHTNWLAPPPVPAPHLLVSPGHHADLIHQQQGCIPGIKSH